MSYELRALVLRDLTRAYAEKLDEDIMRPLGVSEAERIRQAGSGSDFPSSDRAPSQSVAPDLLWSPPRPQDVPSDAERDAWEAAHSDAHTIHRCVLGPQHDGPCRCHCQRFFTFGQVGL